MSGSTAWQFESKGIITLADTSERAQELAIELGAEDLEVGEQLTITTAPGDLYTVLEGLQAAGLETDVAQLTKVPQTTTSVTGEEAAKLARLIEALEDLDDVQSVYSTAELDNVPEPV